MTATSDSTPLKTCTKCKECKPVDGFNKKSKARGLGPTAVCKDCSKKAWSLAYSSDKEKFRKRNQANHAKNRDAQNARSLAWHHNNKEIAIARGRARYLANKQSYIDSNNRSITERRKTNPLFAMMLRIRSSLGTSFRRLGYTKRSRTYEILGCEWSEFKTHIEKQFIEGMTWENRSEWHIDHITPVATATTEEEVIALNHFTNLRPMWAKDNIKKSAHITHLI